MKTVEELLNDESFKEQLAAAKGYDEAIAIFRSVGIEVTEEMLKAAEAADIPNGELDEGALEYVAGGSKVGDWIRRLWPPRRILPHGGKGGRYVI